MHISKGCRSVAIGPPFKRRLRRAEDYSTIGK